MANSFRGKIKVRVKPINRRKPKMVDLSRHEINFLDVFQAVQNGSVRTVIDRASAQPVFVNPKLYGEL